MLCNPYGYTLRQLRQSTCNDVLWALFWGVSVSEWEVINEGRGGIDSQAMRLPIISSNWPNSNGSLVSRVLLPPPIFYK